MDDERKTIELVFRIVPPVEFDRENIEKIARLMGFDGIKDYKFEKDCILVTAILHPIEKLTKDGVGSGRHRRRPK